MHITRRALSMNVDGEKTEEKMDCVKHDMSVKKVNSETTSEMRFIVGEPRFGPNGPLLRRPARPE